jgi:hypothetical protein
MVLFDEKTIIHTAHQLKTSEEARLRMEQIIEASPDLDRMCASVIRTNGKEAIKFKNGARILYAARSRTSGRGFSGDLVVLDEAMALTDEFMGALVPVLSARYNTQLWYAASAGFVDSWKLRAVRDRAKAGGDPELAYFEWSAPEGADPDDPAAWVAANPALGIRITERTIRWERNALGEAEFLRERVGIWDDETTDAVIDAAIWDARADRDSQLEDPVAFAVEVSPDRRSSSIAAVGRRPDGLLHVEVVDNRPGTQWLVARTLELRDAWKPINITIDGGGPANSLLPDFREAGLELTELSARELGQACGGFYDDVIQDQLRHLGDPDLDKAVRVARQKPLVDAWRWSRKEPDIAPLFAVTLARFGFLTAEVEGPSAYETREMVTL